MYVFVRFAAAASLTAFGCIIAAGALMLIPPMVEKVRVARTEGSQPPAVQCEQDCPSETASLGDLPTTAPDIAPSIAPSIAPDFASRIAGYGGAFAVEGPSPTGNAPEQPAAAPPPAAPLSKEPALQSELTVPDRTTAISPPDRQQRQVAKPTTTAVAPPDVQRRRIAKPAINEQARLPGPKKPAQRVRTAKRPADDALRAVRRFGDGLQDIPVNSFAPDGRQRTIVIRPTSVQDVYYYSVPR